MTLFPSNRHIVQGTFQVITQPDGFWVAPRLSSKDAHNVGAKLSLILYRTTMCHTRPSKEEELGSVSNMQGHQVNLPILPHTLACTDMKDSIVTHLT